MNKLQKVWNDLDKAYEKMERAIETLSKMDAVTIELKNAVEKFDMVLCQDLVQVKMSFSSS